MRVQRIKFTFIILGLIAVVILPPCLITFDSFKVAHEIIIDYLILIYVNIQLANVRPVITSV